MNLYTYIDNIGLQIEGGHESCLTTWRYFQSNFSRKIRIFRIPPSRQYFKIF